MDFDQTIEQSVNQLMSDLGFADSSPDIKAQALERIYAMIDEELLYTLVSNTKDEDLKQVDAELEKIHGSEEEKQGKMIDLLIAKVPNAEQVITQSLQALFDRMKRDSTAIHEYIKASGFKLPSRNAQA